METSPHIYYVSATAVIAGVVPSTDTTLAASALSTYCLVVKSLALVGVPPAVTFPAYQALPFQSNVLALERVEASVPLPTISA